MIKWTIILTGACSDLNLTRKPLVIIIIVVSEQPNLRDDFLVLETELDIFKMVSTAEDHGAKFAACPNFPAQEIYGGP